MPNLTANPANAGAPDMVVPDSLADGFWSAAGELAIIIGVIGGSLVAVTGLVWFLYRSESKMDRDLDKLFADKNSLLASPARGRGRDAVPFQTPSAPDGSPPLSPRVVAEDQVSPPAQEDGSPASQGRAHTTGDPAPDSPR